VTSVQPVSSAPTKPKHSAWVLFALVTGAIVANINLSIANVALPTIGAALDADQDQLSIIADAFALGLAATVLYLGAVGDRHGRKLLFVIGSTLTIPTAFLAAYAPNGEVLAVARLLGGIAAAMLFPTTLSLISALYSGRARVKAIALWSGVGGGFAALGPVVGGWLLESFWWGSVFLITVPLVIVVLIVGLIVLPWHAHEEKFRIDHRGGVLSVVGIGSLIIAIETADTGITPGWLATMGTAIAALGLFFWWQSRAPRPLVDLQLARHRTFWVAFVAGAITFGSLIGAMFIGQQFTQNVLGYSTLTAALVVVPSAVFSAIGGQFAGSIINRSGSRASLMLGLISVALAFAVMLVTWREGVAVGWVLLAYGLVGAGVGLAATPASRALMGSVPPARAGMGSGFLDLTRDFGGAVVQAIMGGLLAASYASHIRADVAGLPPDEAGQLTDQAADEMASSFTSAVEASQQYSSSLQEQVLTAASTAFTAGKSWAILVALVLTILGLVLVLALFPRKAAEEEYYAQVQQGG
jgi:EmrB/QacA subfamily drug resistance transporter